MSLSVLSIFPIVSLTLLYPNGHRSSQIVNPVYYKAVYTLIYQQERPKDWCLQMNEKQKQTDSLRP